MPTILVTGATGHQGGALINALLSSPSASTLRIFALTRNSSSPASTSLASRNVTLVRGDTAVSSASIFAEVNKLTNGVPLDAVFLVTALTPQKPFGSKAPTEEEQALPFIDAAASAGVKHLVFTSVERGASADTDPTSVPHFASKFRIEQHLKRRCGETGGRMTWTILRPTFFMDMLTDDFTGRTFAALWGGLGRKPLQWIASSDIGVFAARAVLEPGKYGGKSIGMAGDELTLEEGRKVFREVFGREMNVGYAVTGKLVKTMVSDVGTMFEWLGKEGFKADVKWCNEQGAMTFKEWLLKESAFRDKK
ncbi:hypothetical protein D0Z07_0587 [Hyphodiscus hymeniophilus]|uniref:NmrA-like domain-containing protein n=1 Tax=Hyphodiscus hymeniophilus TaxID=353542 RepID=A0A9P7B148_9HELO|nr:hypothetical protein D0Z07_0587 [Hyphodiscus hymeniophilus]